MSKHYFILGSLPRSGSTFTSKILDNLLNVRCYNQAFNNIFLNIYKNFYKYKKEKIKMPSSYITSNKKILEINNFLKNFLYLKTEIQKKNTFGHSFKKTIIQKNLFNLKNFYKDNLSANSKKKILGSKELHVEYFIDYFINNDIKVIFLVRNPFDYIYSCCYGKKKYINQDNYSMNFFLFRWKYAVRNILKKKILLIKFEDLILKKKKEIYKIKKFLKTKQEKKNFYFNNSSHFNKLKLFDERVIYNSLKNLKDSEILYIYKKIRKECILLGYLPNNFKYVNLDHLKEKLLKIKYN